VTVKIRKGFWKRFGYTKYPLLSEVALRVKSVHPTFAATERNWSSWGRVYTSALGLERAKKRITFCVSNGAKAVDQDDFGLLLSAVEGEVVEGTRRHGAGAGATDLMEGQGSDKAQMSSTSAYWFIQAILYGELGSRRCECEVVLVHVHSFVGSEESTTTVWTAGNEFCLSHQNKI
jgi:hypothetical protein